jgi:hypothetical protein
MTAPMDPNNLPDDETEFGYGPGMFAPGVASNEGQSRIQDDFADPYKDIIPDGEGEDAIFARAVADRRTDPTDPTSGRDFETLGNPDRYGGQPPLVQAPTVPNVSQKPEWEERKLKRAR